MPPTKKAIHGQDVFTAQCPEDVAIIIDIKVTVRKLTNMLHISKIPDQVRSYVTEGGWNARNNGRNLKNNPNKCIEKNVNGKVILTIFSPKTDWKEWIKTVGTIVEVSHGYSVEFEGEQYCFDFEKKPFGYEVSFPEQWTKNHPKLSKLLRQVFRKAAYCGACRVCEANCRNGCISFVDGQLKIDNCIQCHQCHDIDDGCLLFHSLRHPQGGGKTMKSINSFTDHAPKRDWLVSFFDLQNEFFTEHGLGPAMFDFFRRFLRDAELSDKNQITDFARLITDLGWETDTALGLILVNLAMENPQFAWYINNLDLDIYYEREKVRELLLNCDMKEKSADQIIRSFKRITMETPFGPVLNFGYFTEDEDLVRTKCSISDNRVILYALYKFIEKCNCPREMHLSYLMNDDIERDGISPIRIFGLYDEEELKSILLGLSARYPEFINATFTNDLKTITLREKTSADVLELFREDI